MLFTAHREGCGHQTGVGLVVRGQGHECRLLPVSEALIRCVCVSECCCLLAMACLMAAWSVHNPTVTNSIIMVSMRTPEVWWGVTLCVSCWFKERKQLSKQRDLCGNQPECDGQLCEAQQISHVWVLKKLTVLQLHCTKVSSSGRKRRVLMIWAELFSWW